MRIKTSARGDRNIFGNLLSLLLHGTTKIYDTGKYWEDGNIQLLCSPGGGVIKTQIPFTQLSPRHLDGKTWRLSQCLDFFYIKLSFCNPLVTLMTSRQGPGCRVWFKTGGMTGVRPWHDTQRAWPDLGCPLPPPPSSLLPRHCSRCILLSEKVWRSCVS